MFLNDITRASLKWFQSVKKIMVITSYKLNQKLKSTLQV